MAAPVLSDPVTARLLTRLGADCLQNKIFLLSLVYEAKDEERVNVTIFAHKPKPAHDREVTWKIGLMAGQAAGLPPGIREGPYLEVTKLYWRGQEAQGGRNIDNKMDDKTKSQIQILIQ